MFATVVLLSSIIVFVNCSYEFEYMANIEEKFIKNKTGIHRFIIGGEEAAKHDFQRMGSLKLYGNHNCGASLITDEWVLTAAHYVVGVDVNDLTILLGAHNIAEPDGTEKEFSFNKAIIHKDYGNPDYANDIALLKLSQKVHANEPYITPIALPQSNQDFMPGLNCTTIGWGLTDENILMEVVLKIMDQKECNDIMGGSITGGMICAFEDDKGSCYGDSGGPLQLVVDSNRNHFMGFRLRRRLSRNLHPNNILCQLD